MSEFLKINVRIGNLTLNKEDLEKREYFESLGISNPNGNSESEVDFVNNIGYVRKDSITSIIGLGEDSTEIIAGGEVIMTTNTVEEIYNQIENYVTYKRS